MNDETSPADSTRAMGVQAPVWMLWANPIVRRYARSRLRLRGLGIWMLLTLMVSGFIFFLARQIGIHQAHLGVEDSERIAILPLLVVQGIILFVLATGQVAAAMTAEADEGVLDYQRLAPMTPFAKVVGFLFGLPIREYLLFLVTMPFMIWCLWRGNVPLSLSLQLYGVFLVAAILYHCTGLVAGTVVKNRRWAFIISMGLIFLLYTVVPQAANFGLVYFKYLTIYPAVEEFRPDLVPKDAGAVFRTIENLVPTSRFFMLNLPQSVFTILSQGAFILAALTIVWRRWRRAESHLMSKLGATSFFVWIQVVLIGNALPLVSSGKLFPSREFDRRTFGQFTRGAWEPTPGETEVMVGAYGVVTLLLLWVMTLMITPSENGQIRGWRRARKQGRDRLSPFSDPASAFPWVAVMVAAGSVGWFLFARALFESDWFPGTMLPLSCLAAFTCTLVTAGFGFHALMEGRGARATGLAAVFLIVPLMVAAVLLATNEDFLVAALWLAGISPLAMPFEAAGATLPVTHEEADLLRALPPAFWFWQIVAFLVTIRLVLHLRASRKAIAEKTGPSQPGGAAELAGSEERDDDHREEDEREDLPPAPAGG